MLTSDNRVVMVSGAGRGLGASIAQQLHDDGFVVSLGARDVSALEATTANWEGACWSTHFFDAVDATSQRMWVTETEAAHGRIDGLVNNAGVIAPFDFENFQEANLDLMWEVNVKTPARLISLVLPHLRLAGHGRVINIASLSGKRVKGGFEPGYAMTKHAVIALTANTRQQFWDEGVRATAICPSWVDTDMIAHIDHGSEPVSDPTDIARLVATALLLPDNASVAEFTVNCRAEAGY